MCNCLVVCDDRAPLSMGHQHPICCFVSNCFFSSCFSFLPSFCFSLFWLQVVWCAGLHLFLPACSLRSIAWPNDLAVFCDVYLCLRFHHSSKARLSTVGGNGTDTACALCRWVETSDQCGNTNFSPKTDVVLYVLELTTTCEADFGTHCLFFHIYG